MQEMSVYGSIWFSSLDIQAIDDWNGFHKGPNVLRKGMIIECDVLAFVGYTAQDASAFNRVRNTINGNTEKQ